MYINRALLLMVGIAFIFLPTIEEWVISGGTAWYRPFLVWLLIIVAAYWNQHSRQDDEL